MALEQQIETITNNLRDGYKQLVPGTFQHVDQLTNELRTNHDLRCYDFYTSDGELYTVQERRILWGIVRGPQNLVLKNLDEAYPQLIQNGNYFPALEEAQASFKHPDTVVIDVDGLELVEDTGEYSHFVIDPKKVKKLNSQRRLAAQRIYGPDEDNFGQNIEMFAAAGKSPWVFVPSPDYVKKTLKAQNKKYLGRASWLCRFGNSRFNADDYSVNNLNSLRGVRRASEQKALEGRALKIKK